MVVLGEMLEVGGCIATASKCDVEAVVVGQSLYDSRILHVVANAPNSLDIHFSVFEREVIWFCPYIGDSFSQDVDVEIVAENVVATFWQILFEPW